MRGSVRRGFGSGAISKRAAEKHFNFGTVSDIPEPLTVDDGGLRDRGSVGQDHIDNRRFQKARGYYRGTSDPDYNPARVGTAHIDERALQQPQWNKWPKQKDRPVVANAARARRSSADEYYFNSAWYGAPSKRQGG